MKTIDLSEEKDRKEFFGVACKAKRCCNVEVSAYDDLGRKTSPSEAHYFPLLQPWYKRWWYNVKWGIKTWWYDL